MKKILIAEDDQFLGNAYRVKFTDAGFDIQFARDGKETIEKLATFSPDLILLDLMMPKKDGFAVLAELKAHPVWKHIPVIIASNLGQKEDMERATNMGADAYIVKSDLSLEVLIQKINKLLGI